MNVSLITTSGESRTVPFAEHKDAHGRRVITVAVAPPAIKSDERATASFAAIDVAGVEYPFGDGPVNVMAGDTISVTFA